MITKAKPNILQNERFSSYLQIVIGCVLGAIAYPMCLIPNNIAPGGLTGVATILHFLLGWPVGTVSLILNIPLFVIGYKAMGRIFVLRSFIATVLFSVFIDLIPLPVLTDDPLLGSIFGGVLLGAGLGMILRGGATTGGSDMVARLVHKRLPHITVGAFLMFIDCCVVLAAGFFIEVKYALYAFINIYVCSRIVDLVMKGFASQKACYVITSAHEQVKLAVMERLDRGVTLLMARGGYSGAERPVLLCILSAQEVTQLKTIVLSVDEKAFVFITDAYEVLGEGFAKLRKE